MSNYIDTIFFIGKCLTISTSKQSSLEVKEKLKENLIDWDSVVKVSTAHFVLPALYSKLLNANYLGYLPKDLVRFMEYIYTLNYERNLEIIEQSKEINALILKNRIKVIFLKGTGFLLENLYDNKGERMIGDIDILVSEDDLEKTIDILKENGYKRNENKEHFDFLNKHYPKIVKPEKICALEVHTKMVLPPYNKFFNFSIVQNELQKTENQIEVLSYNHQIIYTCINKQINNRSHWFKNISLRNSYDLYLLSKKTPIKSTLEEFNFPSKFLENFIISSYFIFNSPKSLSLEKDASNLKYIKKERLYLKNNLINILNHKKWKYYFNLKYLFLIINNSINNKKNRKLLIKRLTLRK